MHAASFCGTTVCHLHVMLDTAKNISIWKQTCIHLDLESFSESSFYLAIFSVRTLFDSSTACFHLWGHRSWRNWMHCRLCLYRLPALLVLSPLSPRAALPLSVSVLFPHLLAFHTCPRWMPLLVWARLLCCLLLISLVQPNKNKPLEL